MLPVFVLFCVSTYPGFLKNSGPFIKIFVRYYTLFFIAVSTTIIIFDIGFYQEYFTRINYLAFEYLEFADTILSTIFHQFPYNLLFTLIPVLIFLELKLINKKLKIIFIPTFSNVSHWIGFTLITLIILTILVRGGFQNKPLNFSHSNISQYRFVNQLVINPVWNLGYTYKSLIKEITADRFENIPLSLNESLNIARHCINEENVHYFQRDHPLLRESVYLNQINEYNVVIILLESFEIVSASKFSVREESIPSQSLLLLIKSSLVISLSFKFSFASKILEAYSSL